MGIREAHLASSHCTLLQVPNYPQQQKLNWGLPASTQLLPRPPEAYFMADSDGLWFVTVRETGQFVYIGPGPVTLLPSPGPC